jgi:hypothetical protein
MELPIKIPVGKETIKRGLCLIPISLIFVSCATSDMSVKKNPSNQVPAAREYLPDEPNSPALSAIDQLDEGVAKVCGLLGRFGVSCDRANKAGKDALRDAPGSSVGDAPKPLPNPPAPKPLPKPPDNPKGKLPAPERNPKLKLPEPKVSSPPAKTPRTTFRTQ